LDEGKSIFERSSWLLLLESFFWWLISLAFWRFAYLLSIGFVFLKKWNNLVYIGIGLGLSCLSNFLSVWRLFFLGSRISILLRRQGKTSIFHRFFWWRFSCGWFKSLLILGWRHLSLRVWRLISVDNFFLERFRWTLLDNLFGSRFLLLVNYNLILWFWILNFLRVLIIWRFPWWLPFSIWYLLLKLWRFDHFFVDNFWLLFQGLSRFDYISILIKYFFDLIISEFFLLLDNSLMIWTLATVCHSEVSKSKQII